MDFISNIPWETGSYLKPGTASVTAPCRPTIGWSSSLAMRLGFARLQGFKGCKFDLKYNSNNRVPPRKSNYMDVNSPSGFVQPDSNYTFTFFLSFYISCWVGTYEWELSNSDVFQLIIQPRLCIIFLLKGRAHDFLSWFGIKCSSWTQMNVGTSSRAACCSTGDLLMASVGEANKMLERTRGDSELRLTTSSV